MKWSRGEISRLLPILEQISSDLAPVDGKSILVLCSATGEVAFWLAEMMEQGQVTGLELDLQALEVARHSSRQIGLGQLVEFLPAERDRIPLASSSFDGLVSEFIVYPTSAPTQIGQPEMARLVKPGGKMILTDVVVTQPLPEAVRQALASIGLDYLCAATPGDFRTWMRDAGLINVEVQDLTSLVRNVWEERRANDFASSHAQGYSYLLDDQSVGLGKTIIYLYVYGEKPLDEFGA